MQTSSKGFLEKEMTSVVYLYDGSFEGLLHAVAVGVKSKEMVQDISDRTRYRPQLFGRVVDLVPDREQAGRLMHFLYSLHPDVVEIFVNAYLSECHDIGMHLYRFVCECVTIGKQVLENYSHDSTRYLLHLNRKVYKEVHRYKGVLRFRRMHNGILYAPFSPEFNVLGYLARHFRARLANVQWVLHDLRRNYALFWDSCELNTIAMESSFSEYVLRYGRPPEEEVAAEEQHYQELWQAFHHSISNKQRENKQLQKKYIPERYWRYMVEQQ